MFRSVSVEVHCKSSPLVSPMMTPEKSREESESWDWNLKVNLEDDTSTITLRHQSPSPPTPTNPYQPHTTATMVKLEEVEDEHFNTQQTGEDAWISDSDSGEQATISCAASHISTC